MAFRDESYDLGFQIHTENYELTPREREDIEADLQSLAKVVRDFPVAQLHLHIHRHPRTSDFHVKTSLRLPGRTLFTGERDRLLEPACERCARKLVNKVKGFKERLAGKPTIEKATEGTLHEVWPEWEPDKAALEKAADEKDYGAFRRALTVYDDPLEKRIGRRIRRYPEAEALLGREILLAEFVEEVYLNAFERFSQRPASRLGDWLESLIDPSIRTLLERTDSEKENIAYLHEIKPMG
jgi:ribosome-associated translation inhibitor RaiA